MNKKFFSRVGALILAVVLSTSPALAENMDGLARKDDIGKKAEVAQDAPKVQMMDIFSAVQDNVLVNVQGQLPAKTVNTMTVSNTNYLSEVSPEEGTEVPLGGELKMEFLITSAWANYYTTPVIVLMDSDKNEIIAFGYSGVAPDDGWLDLVGVYTCHEEDFPVGSYYFVVYAAPCNENGTLLENWKDFDMPQIMTRFYIVEASANEPHIHTIVYDPRVEPTCTTIGLTEGSHCSECGEVIEEQRTIPMKDHIQISDISEDVAATCTEDGYYVETTYCSECNKILSEKKYLRQAKGHTWDDGIVTMEPTYSTEGNMTFTCIECHSTKMEPIPMLDEPETPTEPDINVSPVNITKIINKKNGVEINWEISEDADSYNIYCKRNTDNGFNKLTTLSWDANSYLDSSAVAGETVSYYVTATVGDEETPYTVQKWFYLQPSKSATLTNISDGVKVKWKKVTGATGYDIYRSKGSGAFKKAGTAEDKVTFNDTKATSLGSKYRYKIRAYKKINGKKYYAAYSSINTIYKISKPKIKSIVNASKGYVDVTLKKKVAKVDGYRLEYSDTKDFKNVTYRETSGNSTLKMTLTGPKAGTKYYVRICSYKKVSKKVYYSDWTKTQTFKAVGLNNTKLALEVGNTKKLKVLGTSKKVTWKSSNTKVATVSKKGKVTTKKSGSTTITATVGGLKYTCKISVEPARPNVVDGSSSFLLYATTDNFTYNASDDTFTIILIAYKTSNWDTNTLKAEGYDAKGNRIYYDMMPCMVYTPTSYKFYMYHVPANTAKIYVTDSN